MSARKRAYLKAVELAKVLLGSVEINFVPAEKQGENVAEFIETLTSRLEKLEADED